jgi:hypothetical protein
MNTSITNQQLLEVANRLAKFLNYTSDNSHYCSYDEFTERANISIQRTCLWCADVWSSDYFHLHHIAGESEKLLTAIEQFSSALTASKAQVPTAISQAKEELQLIVEQANTTQLTKAENGRPKSYRSRYLAAVIANCYFEKFQRWPDKTKSGKASHQYVTCVEDICTILDPRKERASSDSCTEFLKKPWKTWGVKEIPRLKNM